MFTCAGKSAYATMLLREVLKVSTGGRYQKLLNKSAAGILGSDATTRSGPEATSGPDAEAGDDAATAAADDGDEAAEDDGAVVDGVDGGAVKRPRASEE